MQSAVKTPNTVNSISRSTRPQHDGKVNNQNTFVVARQNLLNKGPQNLHTSRGTSFTAEAHVTHSSKHNGQECIKISGTGKRGKYSIYIYECCWGHVTNCSSTYIDVYTPVL